MGFPELLLVAINHVPALPIARLTLLLLQSNLTISARG